MTAVILPTRYSDTSKEQITKERMAAIERATVSMMSRFGRRPCPASGQYKVGEENFGREAGDRGDCADGAAYAPVEVPTGVVGPTSNLIYGTVPIKKLGLSPEYYYDGWGRPFSYVVDKRTTLKSSCVSEFPPDSTPASTGDVEIIDAADAAIENTMYALISHGKDGFGAFPPNGSAVADRMNTGSTDASQRRNAAVDGSFAEDLVNGFYSRETSTTYDDIVWYSPQYKNTCCIGEICEGAAIGIKIDGSFNGGTPLGMGSLSVLTGDINGDGLTDIIASRGSNPNGNNIHVIFGQASASGYPAHTADFDGTNGFTINYNQSGSTGAQTVYVANVNNDAYDDIIVSKPDTNCMGGSYYIIYGKAAGWAASIADLTTYTNGTTGFRVSNARCLRFASGDLNGDGYTDLVFSDVVATAQGVIKVFWGSSTPFGATLNFNAPPAGTTVITSDPALGNINMGHAIGVGNFNGDAYLDLYVTAVYGLRGYVFFGRAAWPTALAVATMGASDGMTFTGINGNFGNTLDVRDLNGDGLHEFIVGNHGKNVGSGAAGGIDVLFGTASPPVSIGAGSFDGTNGFSLNAVWANSNFYTLQPIGDVTGDGYNDLIATSVTNSSNSFVMYGKASGFAATTWTSGLVPATTGHRIASIGTSTRMNIGDVNQDGVNDILAADYTNSANYGRTNIYFGKTSGWADNPAPDVSITSPAADRVGAAVASGDFNNDGHLDIAFSAPGYDPTAPASYTDGGAIYILWGSTEFAASISTDDLSGGGGGASDDPEVD